MVFLQVNPAMHFRMKISLVKTVTTVKENGKTVDKEVKQNTNRLVRR